jgi:hypothetical protein
MGNFLVSGAGVQSRTLGFQGKNLQERPAEVVDAADGLANSGRQEEGVRGRQAGADNLPRATLMNVLTLRLSKLRTSHIQMDIARYYTVAWATGIQKRFWPGKGEGTGKPFTRNQVLSTDGVGTRQRTFRFFHLTRDNARPADLAGISIRESGALPPPPTPPEATALVSRHKFVLIGTYGKSKIPLPHHPSFGDVCPGSFYLVAFYHAIKNVGPVPRLGFAIPIHGIADLPQVIITPVITRPSAR